MFRRVESDDDDSKTSLSGSGSQDKCKPAFCYLGDKHIPVYASEIKEISSTNIARLLLDSPKDKVASKPPIKIRFLSLTKTRLVFETQRTGKQMVLAFLEMMEVMLLPIMRKRLRKSVSFRKPNPKTATAQQFFSRERTGCTPIS